MYTISKVLEGIILTCQDCAHIERVSQFNLSLGSQRTQAGKRCRHTHVTSTMRVRYSNYSRTNMKCWRRLR